MTTHCLRSSFYIRRSRSMEKAKLFVQDRTTHERQGWDLNWGSPLQSPGSHRLQNGSLSSIVYSCSPPVASSGSLRREPCDPAGVAHPGPPPVLQLQGLHRLLFGDPGTPSLMAPPLAPSLLSPLFPPLCVVCACAWVCLDALGAKA